MSLGRSSIGVRYPATHSSTPRRTDTREWPARSRLGRPRRLRHPGSIHCSLLRQSPSSWQSRSHSSSCAAAEQPRGANLRGQPGRPNHVYIFPGDSDARRAVELPRHTLFIGGKWVEPVSGEYSEPLAPATNEPIAEVASGGKEDTNAAVEAARTGFENPEWRGMDPSKRGRLLYALGQLIRDNFEDLARTESQNVGKPLREAKGDVAYVYKLFEYYAGLADKIEGATIPVPGNRLDYTVREPVGVTGHIAPWNYPLTLACRGIAPALAAGNTVVLKPASLTPLSTLKLAELTATAGFPAGVFNVVTGPGSTAGSALADHPDVDSMTFTGSTETGKQIMALAARHVTPVALQLGGKNPQVVLPDPKHDRARRGD